MSYSRRVWKTPSLINNLVHGFDWATDADINERLLLRYRNYDYLTDSDTANSAFLNRVVKEWHDYCDKLYETTILQYDPLLNYDITETGGWTDAKHKGTKASTGTDLETVDTPRVERVTENTGYGFDSGADGTPVGKTTEVTPTGTDTRRTTGTAANNYTTIEDLSADKFDNDVRTFQQHRKFGNAGVTKTQELIEAERKIIIDVIDFYIEKFARSFSISSHIAFEPFEEV